MGLRETFRENLKFYRKRANLTQEKLSELCGCNQNYIAEIERTSSKFPKPETIDAIAAALNIHASDLFIEKGCPKNLAAFDSEQFTREVISELSENLSHNMLTYLKKKTD